MYLFQYNNFPVTFGKSKWLLEVGQQKVCQNLSIITESKTVEIEFVNASLNKPQFYFVVQDNKVVDFDLELLRIFRLKTVFVKQVFFKFASFKIKSINIWLICWTFEYVSIGSTIFLEGNWTNLMSNLLITFIFPFQNGSCKPLVSGYL